jgi:pimeloyl-ACP methyl ester carboxylesterase
MPLAFSSWFLLLTALTAFAQVAQPPAPLGTLVDIGGYRLHLWCLGQENGKPPVVFLPGAGDFSFTWGLVLPEVARFTRACRTTKPSKPGVIPVLFLEP